jgi:CheY-like chemotaxis protein/anti-sigma regulatory factor (Ser/Thr protein kinase)
MHLNALAQDVELNLMISPEIPSHLLIDGNRVRQILNNLLSNAIKFSGRRAQRRGRVQLVVSVEPGERRHIAFSVIDNGIGIAPEALVDLFEPFMQAERSTTRRFGGTGLGLAITRRLADLMGGSITVESQYDQGSTFRVVLPMESSDERTALFADDLSEMRCAVIASERYDSSLLSEFFTGLNIHAVRYRHFEDMQADLPHLKLPLIVVLADESGVRTRIDALRASFKLADLNDPVRFLLIGHGQRSQIRLSSDYLGMLDIVRPAALVRGLAVMGGRAVAQPEDGGILDEAQLIGLGDLDQEADLNQPIQILVAEDDPTNRKVLQKQLKALGYSAYMCEDGSQALQAWRARRFTMLLTDLHMPVMDGYALAAAIRMEETPGHRIPIVALTANAVRGEASRAIECGMDEYLSKPIPLRELQIALSRWCVEPGVEASPDSTPSTDVEATMTQAPTVQRSVLEQMVGPDPAMQAEVISDYLEESASMVDALADALMRQDLKTAQSIAHRLKSASRWVGGMALGELCENLESLKSSTNSQMLATYRATIEAAYHELIQALREPLPAQVLTQGLMT